MLSIELDGVRQVFNQLDNLPRQAQRQVIDRLADKVYDSALQKVDAHTKGGALLRSLELHPISDGYEIRHNLQVAEYAKWVHWGTRPHEIRPKHKKALRWTHGNNFVFAKFVLHPGYQGDPWLQKAAAEAPRMMDEIIRTMTI